VKIKRKNEFLTKMAHDGERCPDEVTKLVIPSKVVVHYAPYKRTDHLPCRVGDTSELSVPSIKSIMCLRIFNCAYRAEPTDEEREISTMSPVDFDKAMRVIDASTYEKGLSFMSPSGAPPVIYNDTSRFSKFQSFRFEVMTDASVMRPRLFTFRGTEVTGFKPCLYGGGTLNRAKNMMLAFGVGDMDGVKYAFYQRTNSKMSAVKISAANGAVQIGRDMLYYLEAGMATDVTPISQVPADKLPPARGNLFGDTTAIANYGGWLQTNSTDAFSCMQNIFKEHKCMLPNYVRSYYPDYPYWPREPELIGLSESYQLLGYKCIRKYKLRRGILTPSIADFCGSIAEVRLLELESNEFEPDLV